MYTKMDYYSSDKSRSASQTDPLLPAEEGTSSQRGSILQHGGKVSTGLLDEHMYGEKEEFGKKDYADYTFCEKFKFAYSSDNKNRRKNIALTVFVVLSAITALLLLIILPSVVQSMVDKSTIEIMQTEMSFPTNTSFESSVTQEFHHSGSIPAKAKMRNLDLYWHDTETDEDVLIAKLSAFNSVTIKDGGEVTMDSHADIPGGGQHLQDFNTAAQNLEALHWRIKGTSDLTTPMLPGMTFLVNIDKKLEIKGFDGFPNGPITKSSNTTGGSTTTLYNTAKSTFFSSANIAIHFNQDLHFHMSYNGVRFGVGTIKDAVLLPGSTDNDVSVEMTPITDEQWATVSQITSNYACGVESPVTLGPFFLSKPVFWLEPSLSSMNLASKLPGNKDKGIVQTDMYPPSKTTPLINPFTLTMYNPIDAVYTILVMKSQVYSNGVLISTVDEEVLNIVIPPRGTIVTQILYSHGSLDPKAGIEYSNMKAAGFGYVDIVSKLKVKIGDFTIDQQYNQSHTYAVVHS